MKLIILNTPALVKDFFGKNETVLITEDSKVVTAECKMFPLAGDSLHLIDVTVLWGLKESSSKKAEPKEPVAKKKK